MEINTKKSAASKSRFGYWESETDYEMGNERVLRIRTSTGKLQGKPATESTAFIMRKYKDGSLSRAYTLYGKGDFSETIIIEAGRCSEKSVNAQHALALKEIEGLKAAVVAHYAEEKLATA